jgi:lysophospholipase L1-like esterase
LDRDAIGRFAAVGRKYGVKHLGIVLVPVTDSYVRAHDNRAPQDSYVKFQKELADMCAAAGVDFSNFGGPLHDYHEFKDPYHLNNKGAIRFTTQLVQSHVLFTGEDHLTSTKPSEMPTTNPSPFVLSSDK